MEEGNEFLHRLKAGGLTRWPMFTSCCPGWVRFLKGEYPELAGQLSTAKSPQQMFGATMKTYYAEKMGIDPKNMVVVGIMPCTAKKFETKRPNQAASGYHDVDIALTTRELARMIESAGIFFKHLPDEEFDNPFGESTGAATIFGATGGVMEAALRTAVKMITGEEAPSPDFEEVRGMENIKEADYKVGDLDVKVAVASGTKNAKEIMEKIKKGEDNYLFVEIMGCPGGCINGGGQPIQHAVVHNFIDLKARRAQVLYDADKANKKRMSHENSAIKELYDTYLEKPGSHKAHEILHTSYTPRKKY